MGPEGQAGSKRRWESPSCTSQQHAHELPQLLPGAAAGTMDEASQLQLQGGEQSSDAAAAAVAPPALHEVLLRLLLTDREIRGSWS